MLGYIYTNEFLTAINELVFLLQDIKNVSLIEEVEMKDNIIPVDIVKVNLIFIYMYTFFMCLDGAIGCGHC